MNEIMRFALLYFSLFGCIIALQLEIRNISDKIKDINESLNEMNKKFMEKNK